MIFNNEEIMVMLSITLRGYFRESHVAAGMITCLMCLCIHCIVDCFG